MIDVIYVIAAIFVLAGTFFVMLSAVGILRLPDLYTRMHAASKAGTVGAGFILIAVALVSFDLAIVLRALVGIFFLLLTTPVAAHLLARAAFRAGYRPAGSTVLNEMDAEIKSHL